jgi:hypothetical protein
MARREVRGSEARMAASGASRRATSDAAAMIRAEISTFKRKYMPGSCRCEAERT